MTSNAFDVQVPATEVAIAEAILDSEPNTANTIRRLAFERDKLKEQVNSLIDSCYYCTRAGNVHWKQGRCFGTSIADSTDPKSFLEAMRAIRHNAGIPDDRPSQWILNKRI